MYNSWFDYVLKFEKALDDEPDRIHLTYYEDLKEVWLYHYPIFKFNNTSILAYYDTLIQTLQ
jgi:hypothetical protein